MEKDSRGREVRKLGAASFLLDIAPEGGSNMKNHRVSTRDFPSRYVESSSSFQYSHDTRSRLNRINKRGTIPHEGHLVASTVGIDPSRIGGGVTTRGKEAVIFAESPLAPGIPVVYRTPEERMANPDRLNLDRRHLTVCPILESEEQLRLLNLQHNAITRLQHLGTLKKLVFLDLYDNLITDMSGLEALHSLRVLMLGRNRIHHISGLQALTRLDVLDLHGNMIREIVNLSHLGHLRVLNLAGNDISVLEGVSGLHSLSELNLRRNKITHCQVYDIPSLQRLYLSHNLRQSSDDIVCLSSCNALIDLSIDGNPLSNSSNYRYTVLAHFNQLSTLNQTPVTDEEKTESYLFAMKEERIMREESRKSLLMEERLVTLETIKKEWEEPSKDEVKSSSYYIDIEDGSLALYGVAAIDKLSSSSSLDLSSVSSLSLHYIDFSQLFTLLLTPLKDKLISLQTIEFGPVGLESLVQLQQLSNVLPPSVSSLVISEEGGANPVTGHSLYQQWAQFVFPPHIELKGIKEDENYPRGNTLFEPLGRLRSLCHTPHSYSSVQDPHRRLAGAFAGNLLEVTLNNYRKQQLFERAWPALIDSLIKDTLDWTCDVLESTLSDAPPTTPPICDH